MQGVFNSLERGCDWLRLRIIRNTKAMINRLFGMADPPRQKNYSQTGIRKKKSQTNKTNSKASPARLLNPTRSTQNVCIYSFTLRYTYFSMFSLLRHFFSISFLGSFVLTIRTIHFSFSFFSPFHDRIDK